MMSAISQVVRFGFDDLEKGMSRRAWAAFRTVPDRVRMVPRTVTSGTQCGFALWSAAA
jgi:hypothetical protein